jgi:hypothetical protein
MIGITGLNQNWELTVIEKLLDIIVKYEFKHECGLMKS